MSEQISYAEEIVEIRKAMARGQKFYVHTYLGRLEVVGIDFYSDRVVTGKGLGQGSWAICSTDVDRWYIEAMAQGLGKEVTQ